MREIAAVGVADEQPVPAYSWYALGVLVLVYLLNFVDRQILSILANDIKADLGLDDSQLGFLYGTAFAIFYALFGIPLGRLADCWSRTRLLTIGLSLWSLMTALSGFARSGLALTAARVGVGVGEATASPCAYSLIADWFPKRMRGTAIGIYSSGLFLGSGLSLVIGGSIADNWNSLYPVGAPLGLAGWQAAFLAVGLPGLALAVWVFSLREPERAQIDRVEKSLVASPFREFWVQLMDLLPPLTIVAAARRGETALAVNLGIAGLIGLIVWLLAAATGSAEQFLFLGIGYYAVASWAVALRKSDAALFELTWASLSFMAIVLAYGAICFVGYSVTYWAAPFAERAFAVSKTELGWIIGVPSAVGGFVGVIFGGWLADFFRARMLAGRVMVLLIGMLAPVPLMLIGYRSESLTVFALCNFLVQFATSSALGAAAAASQAIVKPHMRGTATAIFFLGTTLIGLGLGPYVAGYVSEASGDLGFGVLSTLSAVPFGLAATFIAIAGYRKALNLAGDAG